MKKTLRHWATAAVSATAALAFTACVYDPYYTGVGGAYSSGYGDGYGYGGGNFSTSLFVGTGDARWGYDPSCYSYYDYQRRCYYDPYLYGYYPVGYRPPVIIGVPHPYGWRPGHGYCPPPRQVNQVTVANYRNREAAYRNSNYGWAQQVRQQPLTQVRSHGLAPDRNAYNSYSRPASGSRPPMSHNNGYYGRSDSGSRPPMSNGYYGRPNSGSRPPSGSDARQYQGRNPFSPNMNQASREPQGGQFQPAYNRQAVNPTPQQSSPVQRNVFSRNQPRQAPQPAPGSAPQPAPGRSFNPGNSNGTQPGPRSHGIGDANRQQDSRPSKEEKRGLRGLGQG